jgi:hypothetical protein
MEPLTVAVLYSSIEGATNRSADDPPPILIRGTTYEYRWERPVDMLDTLDQMYPTVRPYLAEQPFTWRAHSGLVFTEFEQWLIALYFTFDRPGEGIVFKMWHASQGFK